MPKLNLGSGRNTRIDCINVDVTKYLGVDKVVNLGKFPWPWKSNTIDGVYASHIIEHFPDSKRFILECYRILKPGGFLRLNLPHSTSATSVILLF